MEDGLAGMAGARDGSLVEDDDGGTFAIDCAAAGLKFVLSCSS